MIFSFIRFYVLLKFFIVLILVCDIIIIIINNFLREIIIDNRHRMFVVPFTREHVIEAMFFIRIDFATII